MYTRPIEDKVEETSSKLLQLYTTEEWNTELDMDGTDHDIT